MQAATARTFQVLSCHSAMQPVGREPPSACKHSLLQHLGSVCTLKNRSTCGGMSPTPVTLLLRYFPDIETRHDMPDMSVHA
jgi:hypothetical protein